MNESVSLTELQKLANEHFLTLREYLHPHLSLFRNKNVIIKMGGSLTEDPTAITSLASDLLMLRYFGIKPIVVNGGGKAINRAFKNSTPLKIAGYRVTTESDAILIDTVLLEVATAIALEIKTLSQEIHPSQPQVLQGSSILRCVPKDVFLEDGSRADLKFVGTVTSVDTKEIEKVLLAGNIPIISSTAKDVDNKIYNCNADDVASAVASALQASCLIFMTEADGIWDTTGKTCPHLTEDRIIEMIKSGALSEQILPKLEGVLSALANNVSNISVIDGRIRHAALLDLLSYSLAEHLGTHFTK